MWLMHDLMNDLSLRLEFGLYRYLNLKVPRVFLSPWKWIFQLKGVISPLIQPMVPFCFTLLWVPILKSICGQRFIIRARTEQQYFVNGQLHFANGQCCESWCDCLKQMMHPPCCNQGRPYIIFGCKSWHVCPQLSVDTNTSHKDRIASSFLL